MLNYPGPTVSVNALGFVVGPFDVARAYGGQRRPQVDVPSQSSNQAGKNVGADAEAAGRRPTPPTLTSKITH
jgi:hypothetical protein